MYRYTEDNADCLFSLSTVFQRTWYLDICTYPSGRWHPITQIYEPIFLPVLGNRMLLYFVFFDVLTLTLVKKSTMTADSFSVIFLINSIGEWEIHNNLTVRKQSLFPLWKRPLLVKSEIHPRLELKRVKNRICDRNWEDILKQFYCVLWSKELMAFFNLLKIYAVLIVCVM